MYRNHRFQTYVTPILEAWINEQARERQISASIIICDCVHAAWKRDTADSVRPVNDPARQLLFATIALDALLMANPDETLRERAVAAYHRKLEALGMIAPRTKGGEDGA